jgi:hypothetical protein
MASALIELSGYVDLSLAKKYRLPQKQFYYHYPQTSTKQRPTPTGYILKHSVGHFSVNSEVDVPLTYADYYFVEAMKRYKELKN